MASTTSSPTPSQPTPKLTYDVFLSFRGKNIRKDFLDHLNYHLKTKGIHTFKDNEKLKRGQSIAPSLLQAIQESRIAIVIFSKGYASSTWCLDEIAKIMECKEKLNQIVVPIFYDVGPSHVRKQTGSFEKPFVDHRKRFKNDEAKLAKWRKALIDAANIKGHDLKAEYNGYELDCIKGVVDDIFKQLRPAPSIPRNLVDLEPRLEKICTLLGVSFENVKLIGIWGMGGIGKTTLARAAFTKTFSVFEHSCFLGDIRKKHSKGGMEALQATLLKEVLKDDSIQIHGVYQGIDEIKRRLKQLRVLIVLDDVDCQEQLEKLVGDGEWLCNGSRIIITTRDKHLLTQFGDRVVVECYEVKKLDEEKGIELFSWHAFKKEYPENEFEDLCRDFVRHASGLPLALKVWGSFLCRRTDKNVWESTLEKIKDIPDKEVIEKLRISYDGLDENCKNVFLDIACFFRHQRRDYVEEVLNGCKLHAITNISVLIDRCLLFESYYGCFDDEGPYINMHDLIHEMGLNIARENRSRRWQLNDLDDVPNAVEGIALSSIDLIHDDENISHCIEAFKQMTKLKMFIVKYGRFCSVSLEGSWMNIMDFLPTSLMVLKYPDYPWSKPFYLKKMKNLSYLDLSSCSSLLETPSFATMPNLETLNLSRCKKLKEIHPSVGNLTKLVKLYLRGCNNLEKLPNLNQVLSLKFIDLHDCRKFKNFSEIKEMEKLSNLDLISCRSLLKTPNFAMMTNLENIYLSGCEELKEIHSSIGNLTKLVKLDLRGCSNLEKLPFINQVSSLEFLYLQCCTKIEFFSEIKEMKKLRHLDLSSCSSLLETPNFAMMSNLENLNLLTCEKLKEIHPSVGNLTKLVKLDLRECSNLKKLPTFNQASSLEFLSLQLCTKLEKISEIKEMNKLSHLDLSYCTSLLETPNFSMMANLENLDLSSCEELKEIHPSIGNLTKLVKLDLRGCSNLEKLPNFNQVSSLVFLDLQYCKKLEKFSEIKEMENLTYLDLSSCNSLIKTPNFAMMKNLENLYLSGCAELKEIHPSIESLTKLVKLDLRGCSNLKKLPNFNQVSSLKFLFLQYCTKLENFSEIKVRCTNLVELGL